MTDRESIVAFIRKLSTDTAALVAASDLEGKVARAALGAACKTIADQIERGEDLIPAKPKATIADLLTLHDLDLGALAHKVGVTGEGFTTAQADALCGAYTADDEDRFDMVFGLARRSESVPAEACREIATRGALLRAALSAPTIKVATPRVLQSADEAPCGALIKDVSDGNYTLRLVDGRGFHVRRYSGAGVDSLPVRGGGAWLWAGSIRNIRGAVEVIAEGLTEAECRHLSGLSAADALAWCKARDKACATHDAAVIDRLQRDGDSLRSLLAVIRHALGAGDHDDIVKHARAIKARADRA